VSSNAIGPSMRAHATSNRVRRHALEAAAEVAPGPARGRATVQITPAPPPLPQKPPRPLGDLATAPAEEIVALVATQFSSARNTISLNRRGMGWLLEILTGYPGPSWQERWEAAGLNHAGHRAGDLAGVDARQRARVDIAAGQAYCMRLIRPSLAAARAAPLQGYVSHFRRISGDPLLEEFFSRLQDHPVAVDRRQQAMTDVCRALTVFGIDLGDITPGALLYYADHAPGSAAATAWPILRDMGVLPAWVPNTLQDTRIRGQRSIEELVDRHQLRNRQVRDLLIDYIRRRSVDVDYSTMENLVRSLAQHFWKIVEEVNPAQADLRLDEATVEKWKQRLLVRRDGKPRENIDAPFMSVRAFYLDLQTWSAAEPERWAHWVAPSPIRDSDLRWFHVRRRRLAERLANRTRERQPLLATLSQHVNDRWRQTRTLLEAASKVGLGEQFLLDGVTWQRAASKANRGHSEDATAPVRVINRDSGELVRISHEEDLAFWQWAIVETLRLAGLRREELVELTHLSVRQYQRPNGEAGHQPVQERPGTRHPHVGGTVPCHRPGDPPAPAQARHRAGLPPLRPARTDLVRAAALPVPATPERNRAGHVHHRSPRHGPPGRQDPHPHPSRIRGRPVRSPRLPAPVRHRPGQ
jgi:hypothetical protein